MNSHHQWLLGVLPFWCQRHSHGRHGLPHWLHQTVNIRWLIYEIGHEFLGSPRDALHLKPGARGRVKRHDNLPTTGAVHQVMCPYQDVFILKGDLDSRQ